jgi:flagellar biosynthesis chaperone FliJ
VKRYKFRLDTVLRVRKIEEDRAIAALAEANRSLVAAEQQLEAGLDRYRGTPDVSGPVPAAAFLSVRGRQDLVAASVVAAGTGKLRAEAHVDIRRGEWSAAATRVAALERLDERRRDEHAVEAQRQELVEVDDMVVARAARRVQQ